MTTFEIHWLAEQEPPSGRVTHVEADTFTDAVWEATRLLRAKIRENRPAVEQGLYGNGFQVYEAAE